MSKITGKGEGITITVEEKGGCGSSIGIGALAIAALTCGVVISNKKRR